MRLIGMNVPPPPGIFALVGSVLAGAFLTLVATILTSLDAPVGEVLILGGGVILVVVGAVVLANGIESRRRYVYAMRELAMDQAIAFDAIAMRFLRERDRAEASRNEILSLAKDTLQVIESAEDKLCDTGAYAAAAIVHDARRRTVSLVVEVRGGSE
jgi:membrane-bound ClpP family serine protease